MDQLRDAEIISFIVWYMWTWSVGILFVVIQYCFCGFVASLFISACVSLALCLDSLFNHWLIKEPVVQNHFRLFFGVLRYAVMNKYPQQRSASTYWEDKPYSRIDLAKNKYGGPFTTEQVEDVKIVLRISGSTNELRHEVHHWSFPLCFTLPFSPDHRGCWSPFYSFS